LTFQQQSANFFGNRSLKTKTKNKMKKTILVVTGLIDDQKKAKRAILKSGNMPIFANNLEDGVKLLERLDPDFKDNISSLKFWGVMTELYYQSKSENPDHNKLNGLPLVALCIEKGIRVAICSKAQNDDYEFIRTILQVLRSHQNYPFFKVPWNEDKKKWEKTLKELLALKD
jgi:hypothetical protein